MSERDNLLSTLIWKKFHCLDDGFVCLVDVMGDDASIVQAARVSYGAGTKHVSDDRTLIRYLMRHRHSTPFEMAELKFLIRIPMDAWRQMIRHRTASVNEYSTRYSEAIDSAQKTAPNAWRLQAVSNRQGSSSEFLPGGVGTEIHRGDVLSKIETDFQKQARDVYEQRLADGVAREQARKDLPLSTYTEAYWKIDLHNLFHFLGLRMDAHAQQEIREYANVIGHEIVARLFPLAWGAFTDYRLNSMTLTRLDIEAIRNLIEPTEGRVYHEAWNGLERCRERDECEAKLVALGLLKPNP